VGKESRVAALGAAAAMKYDEIYERNHHSVLPMRNRP
jgi:hypothetical protein